jgi:hypothetical protein
LAYMLPIEPVFNRISNVMSNLKSKNPKIDVNVPSQAKIEALKNKMLTRRADLPFQSALRSRPPIDLHTPASSPSSQSGSIELENELRTAESQAVPPRDVSGRISYLYTRIYNSMEVATRIWFAILVVASLSFLLLISLPDYPDPL